jgi:hypothetical protein
VSLSERQELESRLARPDAGENGYAEGSEEMSRLEALRRLRELAERGDIQVAGRRGGINTHVHTAKSFSLFASPAAAAWQAYLAGIAVFGINDHYTLAGHREFGEACRILDIRPAFSMEAVAMWEEAERQGRTVNDPDNPGRTYLTAKGITRDFPPGCRGERDLARMNAALLERNREITARLAALCEERLGVSDAITFDDVLRLTPHGQPTERHVSQAVARFLEEKFPSAERRREQLARLTGAEVAAEILADPASLQNLIRSQLIKAGKPAYVEESSAAFIPVERMVSLAEDLDAIPTYPVLGNPVTPWEEDLEELCDRLERLRIRALEVIPDRNTRERLRAIVQCAARRGLPIFNGTEHNTPSPRPLVDKFFFDEEFRPHFERGAEFLLAHQAAAG